MTASTLPWTGTGSNGQSSSNKYSFNPALYTASAAFTPLCTGTNDAVTGVTTAATAFDYFSLLSSGSPGAFLTAYTALSVSTTVGVQNKAFAAALSYEARNALLPLVKAEYFAGTLAPALITTITDEVTAASNSLTVIQTGVDSATKTALSTAYTAEAAVITAALNRLKTVENKIYLVGDSIDVTSAASNTAYAAITTLTSFTGTKTPLSALFDPAQLGNGGTAIPSLTASTFANAGTLQGYYSTAATALAGSTLLKQLQATTEMTAQTTFDLYCGQLQGYLSAGTTGNWASGSATVGIIPGIDYELHIAGTVMSAQLASDSSAITAAAGVIGAPSVTTNYL